MRWRTCVWGLGLLAIAVSGACITGSDARTVASDDSARSQVNGPTSAGSAEAVETYELAFSTYLGGSAYEQARDIFVDDQGYIYITGGTQSSDFHTTPGAYDTTFDTSGTDIGGYGYMDAFVTKLQPDGSLDWSTYLGGGNYDRGYAIEVDTQGYVYVAGRAGPDFPTTPGVFQPTFQGADQGSYGMQNGFVAKLAPDGSALVWASYVGVGYMCRDLDIDDSGNIYVPMGYLGSGSTPPAGWFTNAFQASPNGGLEVGVVKIEGDGSQVLWATWIGGSGNDHDAASIRADESEQVYFVFSTESDDMITTPGAYTDTHSGGVDYFVGGLSSDGSSLLFGTYLGGSGAEWVSTHNLALDEQGNVYVSVWTNSYDFPTTPGAFRTAYQGGPSDMAVAKLTSAGVLLHSTYLGGNSRENPDGIYVDSLGNVFLTGQTDSMGFPTTVGAYQASNGGGFDAVLIRLSADFSELLYSTYMGGGSNDLGRNSFLGQDGALYMAGETAGTGWPTHNALQGSFGGGTGDAVVAKFTLLSLPVRPENVSISGPGMGFIGVSYPFTATVDPVTATLPITYVWQATGQSPVTNTGGLSDVVSFTWNTPGTQAITVTATNAGGPVTDTHTVTVVAPPPLTGVEISGPTTGVVGVGYSFTATVSPGTAALPITYVWQATGQTPVTHVAGLTDIVSFTWVTTGTQAITVTATNAGGMITGTHAITTSPGHHLYMPLICVTISGLVMGLVRVSYSFAATADPVTATLPITYVWQATGQSPVTNTGGLSDRVSFTWNTPGTQAITLTAANAGSVVTATHAIVIDVPSTPISPTDVAISGSGMGFVGVSCPFTATVDPVTATLPITYVWQATGQSPVTNTGGLSDGVSFTWNTPGTQAITVTATNAGGTVADIHTIEIVVPSPPTDVTISGPTTGLDSIPYVFTATVSPDTVALPTTFTWRATEQDPVTSTGGLSNTVTFTWNLTGTKTITIAAMNPRGMVSNAHLITISSSYKLYLPLILRSKASSG